MKILLDKLAAQSNKLLTGKACFRHGNLQTKLYSVLNYTGVTS